MTARAAFKTDAVVKSSLNTGLIAPSGGRGQPGGAFGGANGAADEPTSSAYLDGFQEEMNKRIDTEILSLVNSMAGCVELAKVGNKDRFKAEQDSLEIELKAEAMVRAVESLLSVSHSIKLLFLLNSEDEDSAKILDAQQEQAAAELKELKREASQVLGELMSKT